MSIYLLDPTLGEIQPASPLHQQTEWELNAHEVWVLAGYLQIAMRHPATHYHSGRDVVADFLRLVRETLIEPGSAMEEVWLRGEQGTPPNLENRATQKGETLRGPENCSRRAGAPVDPGSNR